MNTEGRSCASRTASATSRVPSTRLLRMRSFCVALQRFPAMFSPARCTTASAPSTAEESIFCDVGSQVNSSGFSES